MGDSEKENEQSRTWPQVNVLKVGHHGSKTSSTNEFLNIVEPKVAIIGVGKNNNFGHPNEKVVQRLRNIRCENL